MHVVTTARPSQPAAPLASQPAPGERPEEPAPQPDQDIVARAAVAGQQVSKLQADNARLRRDNERLTADVERIRAVVRQIGGSIAQQASQLLADTEE